MCRIYAITLKVLKETENFAFLKGQNTYNDVNSCLSFIIIFILSPLKSQNILILLVAWQINPSIQPKSTKAKQSFNNSSHF